MLLETQNGHYSCQSFHLKKKTINSTKFTIVDNFSNSTEAIYVVNAWRMRTEACAM